MKKSILSLSVLVALAGLATPVLAEKAKCPDNHKHSSASSKHLSRGSYELTHDEFKRIMSKAWKQIEDFKADNKAHPDQNVLLNLDLQVIYLKGKYYWSIDDSTFVQDKDGSTTSDNTTSQSSNYTRKTTNSFGNAGAFNGQTNPNVNE